MHTNVVVVVHAVAVASLSALQDRNHLGEQRSLLRAVQARTERWPSVPAPERRGRYEDVAAVAAGNSLDSAISNWARATVDILTSRRWVGQTALQVAAGDALILTATAGTVDAAATQLGIVDANLAMQARSALEAAHAAWRAPTSWPSTVRLEGVRDPDHIHASRKLRQAVTGNLRVGRDWLPAGAMAERSSGTVTSRAAVPSEASSHGPAVT